MTRNALHIFWHAPTHVGVAALLIAAALAFAGLCSTERLFQTTGGGAPQVAVHTATGDALQKAVPSTGITGPAEVVSVSENGLEAC